MALAPTGTSGVGSEADEAVMSRLFISVFGGIHIRLGGREIPLANRKARALLAYLALSETRRERREHLAGLLWPDTTERNARGSLRQVLLDIREALGSFASLVLVGGRQYIALGDIVDLETTLILTEIADGKTPRNL